MPSVKSKGAVIKPSMELWQQKLQWIRAFFIKLLLIQKNFLEI